MQARFYTKFLNSSFRGTVDKLRGGKFSVHSVDNREAAGTIDGLSLTQYMYTPRIPHVTSGMLDSHPISLHEVDEIKSMEWYAQSCRLRSHHLLSADVKVKDEKVRVFLLTTRVDGWLKSWVTPNRCFNAKFPHPLFPDLLLIVRDILCGMKDVQLQTQGDHLNINLDTLFLVSLGGRHRAMLSHMVEAKSQEAKLDSRAFDELLNGIFKKAISSELQDLVECHVWKLHNPVLEGPYKWVETARAELEAAWISYQKTLKTPFVFPKWKKALGGYSIQGFEHRNEDSLLDFIKVSRNLGDKPRGLTEAGVDALLCRLYPDHMIHMFHVAAIAYPKYSCRKCF